MKKVKENISIFELSKISSQQEFIMKAWKEDTKCSIEQKGNTVVNLVKHITTLTNGKETSMIASFNKIPIALNNTILGKGSKSMTPPFLLTFEIFNLNVHNLLVDFGASYRIIPYDVSK